MNPGVGGGPVSAIPVTMNNVLPNPDVKQGAPRMILGQQVIGARPGQPVVSWIHSNYLICAEEILVGFLISFVYVFDRVIILLGLERMMSCIGSVIRRLQIE